ncbi:MAG: hypothetical protein ACJ790_14945 [Myxococcaceae bacterium]
MQVLVQVLARRKAQRGQAMVLSALSMFLLALMMILSFNVGHAVHEKIRLQQHSDAQAYSMAVVEARALNYFAVSNRALAAALVSMNNLHAYMSLASITGNYMRAGRINMLEVAGIEFIECACWTCFMHCIHGFQALGKMSTWGNAANKWDGRVAKLDPSFRSAVTTLQLLMNTLHAHQDLVAVETMNALRNGQSYDLDKLKAVNAKRASDISMVVGAMNINKFSCAIDGSPICVGGAGSRGKTQLSKEMTAVANGSRNGWAANLDGASWPQPWVMPMWYMDLLQMAGANINVPVPGTGFSGTAKTVNGGKGNLHGGQGDEGTSSSAHTEGGGLFTSWKDGVGFWMASDSYVFSDKNGGGHSPGGAHKGTHKFEGVNQKPLTSCIMTGNCYMAFRADPSVNNDYGQPSVYSYITMPIRMGDVTKAPWELSSNAQIKSELGGSATLNLAAGDGAAVSKAMVYFHRFGSWKSPPNMFDPYWRAKLHPFKTGELAIVLGASGNTDAVALAAAANLPD